MDPVTAALIMGLIGAGGGIASAVIGGNSAKEAAAWNYAINQRNLQEQKQQRQESRDYADEIRREQHLGSTDALGNSTRFIPGEGWVSQLSPQQQQLYDYFINQELPQMREQFQRRARSSRRNIDVANALLDQFKHVHKRMPMNVADELYLASTRGAGDASRELAEAALRQATRTGNSNVANIIAKLGKASMENRGAARLNANMQAEDYENDRYNSQRSGLAQLYQAFLSMANKNLKPSYDSTNVPQDANKLMSLLSQQATQGNSMGFNASSASAPQQGYVSPDYSSANTVAAIGQALSGLGSRVGGAYQQQQMNDLLKQYITMNRRVDLNDGGIVGSTADRLRASGSVF